MAKLTKRSDGRYQMQIYIGVGDDGKKKYKTVYGKTQREVQKKADDLRIRLGKGMDIAAEKDSFSVWRDRWLEAKKLTIAEKSVQTCRTCTQPMEDALGDVELPKIRPADIQAVINDMVGAGYAKSTLSKTIQFTSQIFTMARINRVTDFDPTIAVTIPQRAPVQHRKALSEEQQRWIRETPHRAQTAAMIMMYAGLRRGELIPLLWSDIDLDERTIAVTKSVSFPHNKPCVKIGAKTDAGTRLISIPIILADYLRELPNQKGLVVPSARGAMMTTDAWRRLWSSYMTDLNIKYGYDGDASKYDPKGTVTLIEEFSAHQLRHTYATMLYLAGVDVLTAKEQLGHADIKTTLQIYTHLDQQFKKRAVDKLDSYLSDSLSGKNGADDAAGS